MVIVFPTVRAIGLRSRRCYISTFTTYRLGRANVRERRYREQLQRRRGIGVVAV